MFKSWKSYELDVTGWSYWKVTINITNEEVFVKDIVNKPYKLLIDVDRKGNAIDMITGRVFSIKKQGKNFVILPSKITVSKDNLNLSNRSITIANGIIRYNNTLKEYESISEGIIYLGYYCNALSRSSGLKEIPSEYIYNEKNELVKKLKY